MSEISIKDMVQMLDVISQKRVTDEKFAQAFEKMAELLNEASTALAEVSEATSKAASKPAIDHDALAKALAVAFVTAARSMPPPVIKMDMPAAPAQAAPAWRRMEIDLQRDASGRIGNKLVLTRND